MMVILWTFIIENYLGVQNCEYYFEQYLCNFHKLVNLRFKFKKKILIKLLIYPETH